MNFYILGFAGGVLLAGGIAVFAADGPSADIDTRAGPTGTAAVTGKPVTAVGTTRVEHKIAGEFAIFAGSMDNARSLVSGLRQGSDITLASPSGGGQAGTPTTFTPPTRPMGYGNVRISIALAQEQLIRLGITQPTVEQIQTALVGGAVTSGTGPTATMTDVQGVLQMRAGGMGWGQIANAMGTKLGPVMSGLRQTNQQLSKGQPLRNAPTTGSAGITTPMGTSTVSARVHGQGRGTPGRDEGQIGTGIVTAAGGPAVTGAGLLAGGHARGTGMVTGAGVAVGGHASANGIANGKGHIKP